MKLRLIFALAVSLIVLSSCSDEKFKMIFGKLVNAPESKIERDVKGHEQIYSVQLILRMAQKNVGEDTYTAYDMPPVIPPVPVYQEIMLDKDDNGKITITSERKVFDVIKSRNFQYALEIKYYDVNNTLINHQFAQYQTGLSFKDNMDEQSTLLVHQHFFLLQRYSLNGDQLVYPMTLDSMYYDEFLFGKGNPVKIYKSSFSGIYLPDNHQKNKLKYSARRAQLAVEKVVTPQATESYVDPEDGKTYYLYGVNGLNDLNNRVGEVFEYEYRDTDPIESELGSVITDVDDLNRDDRLATRVIRLRQERNVINENAPLDALGFKGILTFKHSNMAFQMRICICHIITSENGKYKQAGQDFETHKYNEILPAWNSYDIDYPIPFRVIADTDDGEAQCIEDIKRYYPDVESQVSRLRHIINGDREYFRLQPSKTM